MEKIRTAGRQAESIVRVACHELESFYLGDLEAVERGLNVSNLQKLKDKRMFRDPDIVPNPSILLGKITNSNYQKVAGSRAIGPHLSLDDSNHSCSFNVLILGIRKLLRGLEI